MILKNNQGIEMEVSDKAVELLSIVYSNGDYKLQKGEYEEAEDFLIQNGYILWEIFGGKLKPNDTFCKHIIGDIISQWEETMSGNKILTNIFCKHEK